MRLYAVIVIFGLSLFLAGCPDKPEKSEHAMPTEDASTSSVTSKLEIPEQKEGMENMDGENKMDMTTEHSDSQ